MPTRVYDSRTDIANLLAHPEIRGRFMRMDPGPASPMHSHDLGGEIFLVLEGRCEFLIGDERVTCGPGQLIYVEPRLKHTLHAVGDAPCVLYLSVTPHIEPTHTRYDEGGQPLPPAYGTWRGKGQADPHPDLATLALAERYGAAARQLADLARTNAAIAERCLQRLREGDAARDQPALKGTIDELWLGLRDMLQQASTLGQEWNALAPRAMPPR